MWIICQWKIRKIEAIQATVENLIAYLVEKKIENNSTIDFLKCIVEEHNIVNDHYEIELEFKFNKLSVTSTNSLISKVSIQYPLISISLGLKNIFNQDT